MCKNAYMDRAIELAKIALSEGEVPVGAVVVLNGEIIGEGYNRREQNEDVSSHAEIEALKNAAKRVGDWRLAGASLYVTLEPCLMCSGAILQSRVSSLYFGASDEKEGAVISRYFVFDEPSSLPRPLIHPGIEKKKCEELLSSFFKKRRE